MIRKKCAGRIIFEQKKLERLHEKKYVRKHYSLSDSFQEQPALINGLAGGAALTTLLTTTPSGSDYDRDTEFCCRPCQGRKNHNIIKPLVNLV
jgi:hypothetical protein